MPVSTCGFLNNLMFSVISHHPQMHHRAKQDQTEQYKAAYFYLKHKDGDQGNQWKQAPNDH